MLAKSNYYSAINTNTGICLWYYGIYQQVIGIMHYYCRNTKLRLIILTDIPFSIINGNLIAYYII
jgi:hypothetical protein